MSPSVKSCIVTEGWTVYIVCSIHKQPKKVINLSDKLDNKSQWKSVKINNIPEWVHRRYDYRNFDPVYMGLANFWMEEFFTCAICLHNSGKILLK